MESNTYSVWRGNLILVNAENPYRADLSVDSLMPIGDAQCDILMERRAATLLCQLMEKIHGWSEIVAVSGWRSEQEQRDIWNNSIEESGEAFTKQYVAVPGYSEHHTGFAVDLGLRQKKVDFIRPDFPDVGICHTFRSHAAKYGFIERYPAGKEHITGISCEPWHFRYVGVPHAEIINMLGLTLEEYHDMLRIFRYEENPYEYRNGSLNFEISYLLSAEIKSMLAKRTETTSLMLSGNNMDGFIATEWKEK